MLKVPFTPPNLWAPLEFSLEDYLTNCRMERFSHAVHCEFNGSHNKGILVEGCTMLCNIMYGGMQCYVMFEPQGF